MSIDNLQSIFGAIWRRIPQQGVAIVAPSGYGKTTIMEGLALAGYPATDLDWLSSWHGEKWLFDRELLSIISPSIIVGTTEETHILRELGYEIIGLSISYEMFTANMKKKMEEAMIWNTDQPFLIEGYRKKMKLNIHQFRSYEHDWYKRRGITEIYRIATTQEGLRDPNGWRAANGDKLSNAQIIACDISQLSGLHSVVKHDNVIVIIDPNGGSTTNVMIERLMRQTRRVFVHCPFGALSASYDFAVGCDGIVRDPRNDLASVGTHGMKGPEEKSLGSLNAWMWRNKDWCSNLRLPWINKLSPDQWIIGSARSLEYAIGYVELSDELWRILKEVEAEAAAAFFGRYPTQTTKDEIKGKEGDDESSK
jgi:hypothetical protein